MRTIGAKDLRMNLDKVLDDVLKGEVIIVKHRFKEPVRLSAQRTTLPTNSGTEIAKKLQTLVPKLKSHKSRLDPNKSYKELYGEVLQEDPKYRKY